MRSYNCNVSTFFHLEGGTGLLVSRKKISGSVGLADIPSLFSHPSSYLDRSGPRLTINLVTFLLGSSSLPSGRLSVKPETNNNECPVKLQRRMVMLQADLTWERDVVLGNNAGNEPRNRLKAKVEKKGREEEERIVPLLLHNSPTLLRCYVLYAYGNLRNCCFSSSIGREKLFTSLYFIISQRASIFHPKTSLSNCAVRKALYSLDR